MELITVKDRVRNLIGGNHWGEEGRYKEAVLMQILRNHLPETVSVGTGFVIGDGHLSKQIDIIVYSKSIQPFFSSGGFVIIEKHGVKGIVEVKSSLSKCGIADIVRKAHENGEMIGEQIFNGIFAYETDIKANTREIPPGAKTALEKYKGFVNHIAFGKDIFMRYWAKGELCQNRKEHISFYGIEDLSFGYFISNLTEVVSGVQLSTEQQKFYYPIQGGKEVFRIKDLEITFPCKSEGEIDNTNIHSQ